MSNAVVKDFVSKNIGKYIKNSKIKHTWTILINNKEHTIDLCESKRSGKFRIFIDDKLHKLLSKIVNNSFEENFEIEKVKIKLLKPSKNELDLYINNQKFNNQNNKENNGNNDLKEIENFDFKIDFIETFEIKNNSKNLKEYISKKEIEINEKAEYYYI